MSTKFDIFPLINKLNRNDLSAYGELPQNEQQQASPFMAMKFMSGCNDRIQILMLNELVNTYVFTNPNKGTLFSLLAAAATGNVKSVKWPGQIRDVKNPAIEVVAAFHDCSIREAKLMVGNYNREDILRMAEDLGYNDEELKKLKGV